MSKLEHAGASSTVPPGRTLANDLSAHLVYGLSTATAFGLLSPRRGRSA